MKWRAAGESGCDLIGMKCSWASASGRAEGGVTGADVGKDVTIIQNYICFIYEQF